MDLAVAIRSLLTDSKLQGLKPPASGQSEIIDTNVSGLRVRVGASGKITFIVRKRLGAKVYNITIGRYGELSLSEARAKARQILSDIETGADVSAVAQTQRIERNTISDLWPRYKKAKANLRSLHEVDRIFNRYILPKIGNRMADAVTRADVTRLIDQIADTAPVQARAVHAILSGFYGWALPRLDRLQANPCLGAGRPAKPQSRDRVLDEAEIRALWIVANNMGYPWGDGIKLLLLTGQRRSEVFEARRDEFSLPNALWTIPASRAKNDLTHLVPLSTDALELIKGIPQIEDSNFLFPARRRLDKPVSGFSNVMGGVQALVDKELKREKGERWTLHDLRRTVGTGMQKLGVRLEVTEATLNHKSGSRGGIVSVYQRYDYALEKRDALNSWAKELGRIVKAPKN